MIIEEAYYYHFLSSCFYAISRRLFLCKLCLQFTRKSRWKLLLRSRVKKSMFFLENISQISLRKEVRLSGRSETCCVAHIFDFRSEVFFETNTLQLITSWFGQLYHPHFLSKNISYHLRRHA